MAIDVSPNASPTLAVITPSAIVIVIVRPRRIAFLITARVRSMLNLLDIVWGADRCPGILTVGTVGAGADGRVFSLLSVRTLRHVFWNCHDHLLRDSKSLILRCI